MIQQLDNSNFKETINNNEVVLVDFYADWCPPCQALHPTLETLDIEFEGRATIAKINVDQNPELAQQFQVRSIPAIFYFKNGQMVEKQAGSFSRNVLSESLNFHLTTK